MARTTRNQIVCQYCHTRAPVPGRKGCAICVKANREAMRKKREARTKAGVCESCGIDEPAEGRKSCDGCLDAARANWHQRNANKLPATPAAVAGQPVTTNPKGATL